MLRTIIGAASVDIVSICAAEFMKAAPNVDSLIVQKFEMTADYAATATTLFTFGPGINGYVGLERAPGAIRFGEFVDDGEKYVYTTPAPNDEGSQSGPDTGGGGNTDDYYSTDGKFTMDEIADFPDLPADVATWKDGVIEWISEYAINK